MYFVFQTADWTKQNDLMWNVGNCEEHHCCSIILLNKKNCRLISLLLMQANIMKLQWRFHRFNIKLSLKQQHSLSADNKSLFIGAIKWKQYKCKTMGKIGWQDEKSSNNHNQDKAKQKTKAKQNIKWILYILAGKELRICHYLPAAFAGWFSAMPSGPHRVFI